MNRNGAALGGMRVTHETERTESGRWHYTLDLYVINMLHRLRKVVGSLQTQPGIGTAPKCLVQSDCHFRGNSRVTVHDVGKLLTTDAQALCRFRDIQFQWLQAIMPH